MGIPKKYKAPFVEKELYHVYNRTNNKELLFSCDRDKNLFLEQMELFTGPFVEYFSWNLLPNHFHLYVRVKSFEKIKTHLENGDPRDLCKTEKRFLKTKATIHDVVKNAFRRLFISYTTFFNLRHNRKGNLFHRPYKHVRTNNESQLTQTIIYINANAIKHGLVESIEDYPWSSYHSIICDGPTMLLKAEQLEWFGGKAEFIKLHKEQTKYYFSCESAFEDDIS